MASINNNNNKRNVKRKVDCNVGELRFEMAATRKPPCQENADILHVRTVLIVLLICHVGFKTE